MTHIASSAPDLIVSETDGIYEIGINNPARYNAMTLKMWRQFKDYVLAAGTRHDIRAVVIRGMGCHAFMSGADITEFEVLRSTAEQTQQYDLAVDGAQTALITCSKPTIAAINGICMGGGMGIAAACDLRYSSVTSVFRMPAARVGLGYSLESMGRMVDILGVARALDIFFTARKFDGAEAARIGFIHELFQDDDFDTNVRGRIEQVRENAPLTLIAAKQSVSHLIGASGSLDRKAVLQALKACFESKDYQEGQRAFKEKRAPQFVGK